MKNIENYIESTNLSPDATGDDFVRLCKEAITWKFPVVVVPPSAIKTCLWVLGDCGTQVGTVIGFPMGYSTISSKIVEIEDAFYAGASHVDIVVNRLHLRENEKALHKELSSLSDSIFKMGWVGSEKITSKIIIEAQQLTTSEIERICKIISQYTFDYIKTSTGFFGGAEIDTVGKIKSVVGNNMKIKASGGIKTVDQVEALIEVGANRIGTSSGNSIMEAATRR
jgi:deoxyribose-phosphate aldolase